MDHKPRKSPKNLLKLASAVAALAHVSALGQAVGIGFVPIDIPQGFSLVANPFASNANQVQDLISTPPDGFELIKLAGGIWQTNRYSAETETWSIPDMTLTPGEGALASSPEAFAWNSVGKPITGMLENFVPSGESLRSSILPLSGRISTDLGFPAVEGLTVSTVDSDGDFAVTATFENGAWAPEEPLLAIGTSVLITAPEATLWNKDFVLADDDNPLVISEQPEGATINGGEGFSVTVAAAGSESVHYQWQRDGNDIPGATTDTYTVEAASGTDSGSYSVVISTGTHSLRSQQAAVEVIVPEPEPEPEPPVVDPPATGLNVATRLAEDGTIFEVVVTGDPGQTVRIEATRRAEATTWSTRNPALVIGDDGQAIHTERITIGRPLFVRVISLPAAD